MTSRRARPIRRRASPWSARSARRAPRSRDRRDRRHSRNSGRTLRVRRPGGSRAAFRTPRPWDSRRAAPRASPPAAHRRQRSPPRSRECGRGSRRCRVVRCRSAARRRSYWSSSNHSGSGGRDEIARVREGTRWPGAARRLDVLAKRPGCEAVAETATVGVAGSMAAERSTTASSSLF